MATKQLDPKILMKELLRRDRHATARARPKDPDRDKYPFIRDLFDKQQDFIYDTSDHKTALCSRRAGKSYTAVAYLIKEALDNNGVTCVYLALTRQSAKRILMQELNNFNNRYNLGIVFNRAELTATFPNGSSILLAGADDASDIEKLRGSKYALVIIDEAASFGVHIETLIDEVIEPALMDLSGTLCLLGTPGANASGYFYNATTNNNTSTASEADQAAGDIPDEDRVLWSNHHWTVLDNKPLRKTKDIPKWLAGICRRKGWDEDHPIYVREWKGKWSTTDNDLVYQFNPAINTFYKMPEPLPGEQWQHVLGIDIGYKDAFTITVAAFSNKRPTVYIVDQFGESKLIPTVMAEKIAIYRERYDPVAMVADAGSLGLPIVEEFKQRYHLNIKAAEKNKKVAFIDSVNGDLISGRIKVREGLPVIAEMARLQWDKDSNRTKENPNQKNDHADSFLYSTRECRHWLFDITGGKDGTERRVKEQDPFDEETRAGGPVETSWLLTEENAYASHNNPDMVEDNIWTT